MYFQSFFENLLLLSIEENDFNQIEKFHLSSYDYLKRAFDDQFSREFVISKNFQQNHENSGDFQYKSYKVLLSAIDQYLCQNFYSQNKNFIFVTFQKKIFVDILPSQCKKEKFRPQMHYLKFIDLFSESIQYFKNNNKLNISEIKIPNDLFAVAELPMFNKDQINLPLDISKIQRVLLCYLIENNEFSSPISLEFSKLYSEEQEFIAFQKKDYQKKDCQKKEIAEAKRYLRLRGLPFNKTLQDIMDFLEIQCDPNQILIVLTPDGKPQGEALVELNDEDELKFCLKKDKMYMGNRYIDVMEANEDQYKYIKQTQYKSNKQVKTFLNRPIVRIRGVPFRIAIEELILYFSDLDLNEDQVKIIMQSDGRPSGEAILILNRNQTANMVIDKYHKKKIQNRYLEVFEGNQRDYEYLQK